MYTLRVTVFMFEHVMYMFDHVMCMFVHVMFMSEHAMCMFEHVMRMFEHLMRTGAICVYSSMHRRRDAGRWLDDSGGAAGLRKNTVAHIPSSAPPSAQFVYFIFQIRPRVVQFICSGVIIIVTFVNKQIKLLTLNKVNNNKQTLLL